MVFPSNLLVILDARAGGKLDIRPEFWTLAQAVNWTSGRSPSTSEDDPAERGCSRSRTTLGSTLTTPGGSHMTANLGGRYDPWPVKSSTD